MAIWVIIIIIIIIKFWLKFRGVGKKISACRLDPPYYPRVSDHCSGAPLVYLAWNRFSGNENEDLFQKRIKDGKAKQLRRNERSLGQISGGGTGKAFHWVLRSTFPP
jgi:hypothetical protein